MNSFGKRLKLLRKEVGMSQAYIADHIGVSTQSVSNWECDNTMPDISQIVPLAALLSVSTDYLLGVGTNERADKEELEKYVNEIWATYSVNTMNNNADLLVYDLYKNYLNKYPLDYDVKYKCALAVKDYLIVSTVRKKFEITKADFEIFWVECDRILRSICDNCTLPEIQINAKNCFIELLLLKSKWDEAERMALKLPDMSGIRDKALGSIAKEKGELDKSCEKYGDVCKSLLFDYTFALFYRAKALADNPDTKEIDALKAWDEMTEASEHLISLYLDPEDLTVNGYEKNPYCYLITSFTSKCNFLLRQGKVKDSLRCAENAINTATEMFLWAKNSCIDLNIMSDILYFAQHTPRWCYKWAGEEKGKAFLFNEHFIEMSKQVSELSI